MFRSKERTSKEAAGRRLGLLLAAILLLWGSTGCSTTEGPDPWERMNRGTFAFNEAADKWVVEPVAKGWDFLLPEFAQTGVENFFDNLRAPVFVANNLLQGEVQQGYLHLWRMILNTTVGVAGFVDVASMAGWPDHPEDFGLTLGHWGVPNGPYLMLPVLGASTVRDTVGLAGDAAINPYTYFVPIYVPIAARATELLNKRAIFLEEIAQSREEAFDFYVFVRNAYLQNREHRLTGVPVEGAEAAEADSDGGEDLYYFDDEDFDDFDEPDEVDEVDDSPGDGAPEEDAHDEPED
jgi:phospholipid-binding lipoprotein MlaA